MYHNAEIENGWKIISNEPTVCVVEYNSMPFHYHCRDAARLLSCKYRQPSIDKFSDRWDRAIKISEP